MHQPSTNVVKALLQDMLDPEERQFLPVHRPSTHAGGTTLPRGHRTTRRRKNKAQRQARQAAR